ncbi:MAG: hypothetical protein AAFQ94_06130 [Bacteroidota bacterium]
MEKKTNKDTKGLLSSVTSKAKDIAENAKGFAQNANALAMSGTEKVVSDSLEITSQWQNVAELAIKGGLKLASNQQNLVFDILDEVKADIKEGNKRLKNLVA